MTDAHGALIYTMVLASLSDGGISDQQLRTMGELVNYLPVFDGFDRARIRSLTDACVALLDDEEGLDSVLAEIAGTLPQPVHETAYALACDLIAAEGRASQEELRLLEMLRHRLAVDRLTAAAIERGSRARYHRLS